MRLPNAWPPLAALVLLCCATVARAEDKPPQVDVDEVRRRGDMVVRTGGGHRAAEENAIAEAMQLPVDDSHKWFILLFTTPQCGPCAALKRDWKTSSELQAFSKPDDAASSWAHLREYDATDPTQKWRKYRISSFPTVVIQPPLGGQYGDPGTIVFQRSGYDGNPVGLANAMRAAIVQYIGKLQQTRNTAGFAQSPGSGGGGYPQPPFPTVNPQPTPFFPAPTPLLQIPPGPTPATLDQLRANCPGADALFLLSQVEAQATLEQAKTAWMMDSLKKELEKQKATLAADQKPKVEPAVPETSAPMSPLVWLAIGGISVALLVLCLMGVRSIVRLISRNPFLIDPQLSTVLAQLQGRTPPSKSNAPSSR